MFTRGERGDDGQRKGVVVFSQGEYDEQRGVGEGSGSTVANGAALIN